jgi:hypothetical protein
MDKKITRGMFMMIRIKRFFFFISILSLLFGIAACENTESPVPTETPEIVETIEDHIHEVFKVGFEYINNRDNYHVHTELMTDAVYFKGFRNHRYQVLFDDPFLKAYGTDTFGEVMYRIAVLNQGPYFIYKHGDNFYKANPVTPETMNIVDFNHPAFSLLKKINKDQVTMQNSMYQFSLTYLEMVTDHPSILTYIDEGMKAAIISDEQADLSAVVFDISVIMNESTPQSFQSIMIEFKEYATLKYPINLKLNDRYEQARLTFEFSYENHTKDITPETTLILDDHHNYVREDLVEITLGQTMMADLQYMTDFDFFKLTILETQTYHFEFSGIFNVIFYIKNSENSSKYTRIQSSDIDLEQGTYYVYVMNYADTVGQVYFSISAK